MNCLRRVRDRRVWDWVIRNCRISCLGRRKWFHIGAARDIGGKTKRGRLIYFLFLYTLLFLIFTYFPFPCITSHSDLSYCLDLITESLSSVSDEFWCTHCCPFHLYFSHLKTLYSFLWNVKEMFSESCGSVSLLWEKKKGSLQMVETESSIQCNRRHWLMFFVVVVVITWVLQLCTLSQQDGLTLNTLLHSLYRDGNLHFL